jgi:hypothetical protein
MSEPVVSQPSAVREVIACALRGFRDAISLRLIFFSIAVWVVAFSVCSNLAWFGWPWFRSFAAWVAAWALLGLFVLFPSILPQSWQAKIVQSDLAQSAHDLLGVSFDVVTWIAVGVLFVLSVLVGVTAASELFLMRQVRVRVLPQYPAFAAPDAKSGPLASVGRLVKFGSITLLSLPLLLIPVLNVIISIGLFGYLNVRTLVNDALEGIASPGEQRAVIIRARLRLLLLGLLLVAALAIPFAGLIGPGWIAAATCHLCYGTLQRERAALRAADSGTELLH